MDFSDQVKKSMSEADIVAVSRYRKSDWPQLQELSENFEPTYGFCRKLEV